MATRWGSVMAALAFSAMPASAIDVTGNWSVSGASFIGISSVSFTQTGEALTACVAGAPMIATGTIDDDTGEFNLVFDTAVAGYFYEFGVCSWTWSGTFALDGASFGGTEEAALRTPVPPGFPEYCEPPNFVSIAGTRIATEVSCCGNDIVEPGEQCDSGLASQSCCANDCSYAAAGTFCGADDQCHLKECDGAGACEPLPPVDCGACYECDPVLGCEADIRSDCSVGGSGARLRAVRRSTETKLNWQWRPGSGPETTAADFGDPTADTDYELCVFTRDLVPSGLPRVKAELASGPAWTPTSSGFRYRDESLGAAGIGALQLSAKSPSRARLKVGGNGVNLVPPLEGSEVIVQLSTRDPSPSRCWSTTFVAPRVNEPGKYIATLP